VDDNDDLQERLYSQKKMYLAKLAELGIKNGKEKLAGPSN
jgi:hypothetical protein